ncbi:MAG: hypothetical protein RMM98_07420 [Acidobacteriota bacterium]|nr:hypothetical protein [Blastocatellia bacterium]MDW8239428.1 hypothetical protein [Acidobacteriota bacterium]
MITRRAQVVRRDGVQDQHPQKEPHLARRAIMARSLLMDATARTIELGFTEMVRLSPDRDRRPSETITPARRT